MDQHNTNTFKFEYGSDEESPSQRYEDPSYSVTYLFGSLQYLHIHS